MFKFIWCAVMLGAFYAHSALAASIPEIREMIEGVYALDEFHVGERVLRPPEAEGRYVLKDGAIIYILLNNADERDRTSITLFGVFQLDETSFAFRYHARSAFRETTNGIVRLPPPASVFDMRKFSIPVEGTTLRLISDQSGFVFMNGTIRYSENGKLLRVWRRLSK